jgi:hypothetical protein
MSLSGSKSRIATITKDLSVHWSETKNYWRDAKAQEFQHRYLDELFIGVERTITVIEKLDELLKKVRSDCE